MYKSVSMDVISFPLFWLPRARSVSMLQMSALLMRKTCQLPIGNLRFRAKSSWIEEKSVDEKQAKFWLKHTNFPIYQHHTVGSQMGHLNTPLPSANIILLCCSAVGVSVARVISRDGIINDEEKPMINFSSCTLRPCVIWTGENGASVNRKWKS